MDSSRDGMSTDQVLYRLEVPWDSYLPSGIVSAHELQLVRRYDKAARDTQVELLEADGPAYADLFISLLAKVTGQEDTVLYTLCLLEDMLAGTRARARRRAAHRRPVSLRPQTLPFSRVGLALAQNTLRLRVRGAGVPTETRCSGRGDIIVVACPWMACEPVHTAG